MTTQHDKAKRWRPWQFSLRTLLVLMLVVASYLGGWMSNEWKQARDLRRAEEMEVEVTQEMEAMMEQMMSAPSAFRPPATEPPATE